MLGKVIITAANAVLPIVLLILLGYYLRNRNFFDEKFLKTGNRLMFQICLPAMLFINVYDIPNLSAINWGLVWYCIGAVAFLFIGGLLISIVTTKEPDRKGVIWQCVFRSNFAIIGLPLTAALANDSAEAAAAVLSAFTIPMFNIFAVIALSFFHREKGQQKINWKKMILDILRNPLITGVVLGIAALVLRQIQETVIGRTCFALKSNLPFLYQTLNFLKSIASPLALIILGGSFVFDGARGRMREISVAVVSRLLLAPTIGIGGAYFLGNCLGLFSCSGSEYAALIALFGTPVAVSSAVMAWEMHSDHQLATQLVVWTSVLSVFTIFLLVCVLMLIGLI